VPSLARAQAVTTQVERERAETVLRHAIGEPVVTPGVLPKTVYDSERDLGASQRPRPIRKLDAVDRVN